MFSLDKYVEISSRQTKLGPERNPDDAIPHKARKFASLEFVMLIFALKPKVQRRHVYRKQSMTNPMNARQRAYVWIRL